MKALTAIFSERLRTCRAGLGWTQQELANRSEVPRTRVDEYEHGRHLPSADALKRLAEAMGCSADYLLGMEAIAPPKAPQAPAEPTPPALQALNAGNESIDDVLALARAQGKTWHVHRGKAYALRRGGWELVI